MSGELVEVGQSGKIGLYICGPTVYNHPHIGNVRAPLFWDVVTRYLKSRGYETTFVQNITDIEDKIINRANEEGVSWEEIVRRYTDSFHERLRILGVGLPDVEPRATERGIRTRDLLHPLRLALTGRNRGPEMARLFAVLGAEEARVRIEKAREARLGV